MLLSRTAFFLKQEFEKRGYQVITYDDPYLLSLKREGRVFYTHSVKTLTSAAQFFICKDKYLTSQVLSVAGFPISKSVKINKSQLGKVADLQFPVVIKPLNLSGGEGVQIGVKDQAGVQDYFQNHEYTDVLVEETLQGEDARILIVQGKYFAAVKRIPAFVTGDGTQTVLALVEQENARRAAIKEAEELGQVYTTDLDPILFDADAQEVLHKQGLGIDSIIKSGRRVFVRQNSNTSTGGISIDITEQVGSGIRKLCEALAAHLGMSTLGIDVMTEDLAKPLDLAKGWGIVEINASPGLDLHILTDEGERHNPVPLIVDEIEEYLQKQGK